MNRPENRPFHSSNVLSVSWRSPGLWVVLGLLVCNLLVYGQIVTHDFVNYDDLDYVIENPHVSSGWTAQGFLWAFRSRLHGHWHPLTWLSHMADCQIFALNPMGHHLTSLLLHMANSLLLFWIMRLMTGAVLRSAFVAALFALHPLHVEPVAWIAARKELLSAFFFMLAVLAYIRYARNLKLRCYALVVILFAMGLMAKPMVIMLPLVLLLLDYWPLNRLQAQSPYTGSSPGRKTRSGLTNPSVLVVLAEKLILVVLMGLSASITLWFMQHDDSRSLNPIKLLPDIEQAVNALSAYLRYAVKLLWPMELSVLYSYPTPPRDWEIVGAALLIVLFTTAALWKVRRYPYLLVGWLWYLLTLLPVIGLVKGVPQPIADRYTYLPLIGLFVIAAWGGYDLCGRVRRKTIPLLSLACCVLLFLGVCSWLQVQYWKDSFTLFKRSVEVAPQNATAHNSLGAALQKKGMLQEASHHFRTALQLKPHYPKAHYNLGLALAEQGQTAESMGQFSEALRIDPNYAEAYNNLGTALYLLKKPEEAMLQFSNALRINPEYALAHYNLGLVLFEQGRIRKAVDHFSEALRLKPGYLKARQELERALQLIDEKLPDPNSLPPNRGAEGKRVGDD